MDPQKPLARLDAGEKHERGWSRQVAPHNQFNHGVALAFQPCRQVVIDGDMVVCGYLNNMGHRVKAGPKLAVIDQDITMAETGL